MSDLDELRADVRDALLAEEDLLYRHTFEWSDGTTCRGSIQDPNRTDAGTKLAQRLTGAPDTLDVRLLRLHPNAEPPGTGATLAWDGGTLKLVEWCMPSDFHSAPVGVCRFTR